MLDPKGHLSTPIETDIAVSAPIVSLAAFSEQLFLLLSTGNVQSLPFVHGIPPSSLSTPVLVQPPIALPLITKGNAYAKDDPVPTVTPNNPQVSAPLAVPSALPTSTALLAVGQVNHTLHLYIGDPVNHRILDLQTASGPQGSPHRLQPGPMG